MRIDLTSNGGRRRASRRPSSAVATSEPGPEVAGEPVDHSQLMGAAVRSVAGEARSVAVSAEVAAIDTRGANLDPRQIGRDDACAFGKWLYNDIDPTRRNSDRFEHVRALHAEFHRQAAHIVQLAQSGDQAAARASITIGTPFAATSAELTGELNDWRR